MNAITSKTFLEDPSRKEAQGLTGFMLLLRQAMENSGAKALSPSVDIRSHPQIKADPCGSVLEKSGKEDEAL